jgi:hypothetical protein
VNRDGLVKFTLLIPVRFNDGRQVPLPVIDNILDDLFDLAKGWTCLGKVTGAYQMQDGSKQLDESLCYWICVRRSKVAALKKLVGKFAAALEQECLFLEETGGKISFIAPLQKRRDTDEGE